MNVRYTLEELSDLAVNETGFCVGVYWRSVTGSGTAHTDDQDWLATERALRARKGMRHLYRDVAPRPSRPRA